MPARSVRVLGIASNVVWARSFEAVAWNAISLSLAQRKGLDIAVVFVFLPPLYPRSRWRLRPHKFRAHNRWIEIAPADALAGRYQSPNRQSLDTN